MKTIALISQKGGTGKSTLASNLAAYASTQMNVLLLDSDPQQTAYDWSRRREPGNTLSVVKVQPQQIKDARKKAKGLGAGLCLVDTAGHMSKDVLFAMAGCDLVLIPCQPSLVDLTAIKQSIMLTREQHNKYRVVFNRAHHPSAAKEMIEIAREQGFSVCDNWLLQRAAYNYSWGFGQSLEEYEPKNSGKDEIKNLFDELWSLVNG